LRGPGKQDWSLEEQGTGVAGYGLSTT